jgi:AraC family transcriptional regulator
LTRRPARRDDAAEERAMLLLRQMPRVEPVAANAAFRRWFYSRWGLENCIVSGFTTRAIYPPFVQRLSIKAAWGGAERYHLDGRSVAVDDDTYLVLNDLRCYASTLDTGEPMRSFAIFFRPGLPEEVFGTLEASSEQLLERGCEPPRRAVEFAEQLRPHDRIVSPLLERIRRQVDAGVEDEVWYEEAFTRLLEAMFKAHRGSVSTVERLRFSRAATRREIFRRIALATDFLHTNYERAITIEDAARAAHLSKYHFIRLFRAVHGTSPHAYLRCKRVAAARRLLATTRLGAADIARRVGFEHRTTLFRNLASATGHSVRSLRHAGEYAS